MKELEKLLPRARDELMRAAGEYDETHADSPITIGGRAPHELVDTIVEEYRVCKDLEKEEKVRSPLCVHCANRWLCLECR